MEIAKAYRSIIMGPQRGNLGRGACFWDSDGKIGNCNRSRFSLVEFLTETSTHTHRFNFFDGIRHSPAPYHIMLWYTTTIICILTRMRTSSKQEEQIDSSAPLFQYG